MKKSIIQYIDSIAALFILVILSASIVFGVFPLVDAVRSAQKAIDEEQIAQDVRLQRIIHKEVMHKEREHIARDESFIPKMPTEQEIIALIEVLERMADDRSVEARFAALDKDKVKALRSKKKKKGDDEGGAVERPDSEKYFMITLTGSFNDVLGILRSIENAQYYIFMDNVDMVPQRMVDVRGRGAGVVLSVASDDDSSDVLTPAAKENVTATVIARIPFAESKK